MSIVLGVVAALSASAAGALGFSLHTRRKMRVRRREKALEKLVPPGESSSRRFSVMGYMENLTRKLYVGSSQALLTWSNDNAVQNTRAGKFFAAHAKLAGCAGKVSTRAFCETRNRFGVAGLALGTLLGGLFSWELAIALALAFGFVARTAPNRAMRDAQQRRAHEAERCLSEMLEVVSLGLRSGLTFDRSFALYGQRFTSEFARSCALAHRRWALGLATREESLRSLAESYDCERLSRVVESVVRGLRLGTAFAGSLEEEAAQSRAAHRAAIEERVAKAPVKMMIPTGTLILPAMLLLVMGPILLELASGF